MINVPRHDPRVFALDKLLTQTTLVVVLDLANPSNEGAMSGMERLSTTIVACFLVLSQSWFSGLPRALSSFICQRLLPRPANHNLQNAESGYCQTETGQTVRGHIFQQVHHVTLQVVEIVQSSIAWAGKSWRHLRHWSDTAVK
jgi:hypothetical protein